MTKLEEVAAAIESVPVMCGTYGMSGEDAVALACAAIAAMREPATWPMDRVAELLEASGINSPRPSEVLRCFFEAVLEGK